MKVAEAELGSAEEEAKKLVGDAIKMSETKKKEALLEAKDEIYRLKNDAEKETKERRSEVQRQERRLQQKEENLDRKSENMEKKEETLQQKLSDAEARMKEADTVMARQLDMLEKISGFTQDQAKEHLLTELEGDLVHEKALKIQQFEQRCKDESDQKAREIISQAIQRCASDHVAEVTVSVVPLPSDEMKGR
ncbi:MAG: Rnase Y domain-containing protein, partial [Angelakisella sp.]